MNVTALVLLAVAAIAAVASTGMKNNGNMFTPTGTFPLQLQ